VRRRAAQCRDRRARSARTIIKIAAAVRAQ